MTVIEKAHELADAIIASQEFKDLRSAELEMMNDATAQQILDEYKQFQEQMQGTQNPEKLTELNEQMEAMQGKMESIPTIATYLDAQDKVAEVLQEVNFILGRAINGEDEESCDTGHCGGGCSGCS